LNGRYKDTKETVKMADEFEMTGEKLAKLQLLFGDAVQNFPEAMRTGADRAIRKEIAKESAIEKVYDHYYELELRRFLYDVNETTEEGTFFKRLETSILRPLIVMRAGDEEQASVQLRKVWTDQVEKYETERVKEEKVSKRRAQIRKELDEYYAKKAIVIQRAWRRFKEPFISSLLTDASLSLLPERDAETVRSLQSIFMRVKDRMRNDFA
jgi:hypothetical protein